MNETGLVYRVVDWDGRHETARSLKKTGPLAEVAVSTQLGGGAISRLLALPNSAAILGVWYFIQALAANCERRGALVMFGVPLTATDLARLSGWDVPLIEVALKNLCGPGVGLLEQVPCDVALRPPVIPPPTPRKPRKPKPPPFTHCPVCNADLVAFAELQETDADNGEGNGAVSGECGANAACVHESHVPDIASADSTPPVQRDFMDELQQIRDLRKQLVSGEVGPDVVEEFIKSHYSDRDSVEISPSSNQPVLEPQPIAQNPVPIVRTDNRIPPRRKKHHPKKLAKTARGRS